MKNKLLDILKGIILGLDSTIPGFSMGTLAVFLNIYERLINAISDLTKHPLKSIKEVWAIAVGFIIGLVLNIIGITFLLKNFPFQTVMFFVGLVIVSIPITYIKKIHEKLKIRDYIALIVSLLTIIGVSLLNAGTSKEISLSPVFLIMMVLVGAIGLGTMIIPGVSGSMIIMALGYYDAVMEILNKFLHIVSSIKEDNFYIYLISILLFALGAIVGAILVSKLIKKLLEKYSTTVYSSILGLLIGSPFSIIYLTINKYEIDFSSTLLIIISVITFILGGVFGVVISKFEKDDKNKKETTKEEIENNNNIEG